MKEVLETVRSLKNDVLFLKENAATKDDLVREIHASEERLEKKIIFGVADMIEQNILPQLDTMSKDLTLIKTALQRPILHY